MLQNTSLINCDNLFSTLQSFKTKSENNEPFGQELDTHIHQEKNKETYLNESNSNAPKVTADCIDDYCNRDFGYGYEGYYDSYFDSFYSGTIMYDSFFVIPPPIGIDATQPNAVQQQLIYQQPQQVILQLLEKQVNQLPLSQQLFKQPQPNQRVVKEPSLIAPIQNENILSSLKPIPKQGKGRNFPRRSKFCCY